MRVLQRLLPFLVLGIVAAGCYDTEREITINPDGSGKIVITETSPRLDMMFGGGDTKSDPKKELAEFVSGIIEKSEGIELWKDVSYKNVGKDKNYFKGTAYFRDISQVKFSGLANAAFVIKKNDDGTMTVTFGNEASADADSEEGEVDSTLLSESDLQHKADSLKENFGQSMAMLTSVLNGMRDRTTLHAPAGLQGVQGFTQKGNDLSIELTGTRIMAVLDSLSNSPEFFKEMARNPKQSDQQKQMVTALFSTMPVAVVRAGGTPLFNYDKEVTAARPQFAKLKKTLKIT